MTVMMVRGVIQEVTEGEIKRFGGSGRFNESFLDRECFQHYGFTSRPLPGAEHVTLMQGNTIIMVASDDRRYRLAVEAGEVALYDDLGQKAHLTRTGIEVTSPLKIDATAPEINATASTKITGTSPLVEVIASVKITATTPLLEVSGDLEVGGDITSGTGEAGGDLHVNGDVYDHTRSMAGDRDIYNEHYHTDPQGGHTGVPVQQE